jgi:hypothetical protein
LPANAATGKQQSVALNSISCASVGDCVGVGSYVDDAGHAEGLLMTETSGVWAPGVEAALPADAAVDPRVYLGLVSCASAGNCSAVGAYADSSGHGQGLLMTETDGVWGTGVEAVLPANARVGSGGPSAISCASAGNCSVVGFYNDRSKNLEPLLIDEEAGTWAAGVEGKLPANAATRKQVAGLNSVSCTSPGACSAVGGYFDKAGNSEALLYREVGGQWKPHVVLLTEKAGHWTRGVKAALPVNAGADQGELGVNSVSCSSPGNCTAAGNYSGAGQDNTKPLLLTETSGIWSRGVGVTLPVDASAPYQFSWVTVSCAAAQNCSGVGFYADNSNGQPGLLLSNATPT